MVAGLCLLRNGALGAATDEGKLIRQQLEGVAAALKNKVEALQLCADPDKQLLAKAQAVLQEATSAHKREPATEAPSSTHKRRDGAEKEKNKKERQTRTRKARRKTRTKRRKVTRTRKRRRRRSVSPRQKARKKATVQQKSRQPRAPEAEAVEEAEEEPRRLRKRHSFVHLRHFAKDTLRGSCIQNSKKESLAHCSQLPPCVLGTFSAPTD